MSNRFIRDLTIGNADERRARQIKGIENATEAPAVTRRPREIGGVVSAAGGISAGGGFTVSKAGTGLYNINFLIPWTNTFVAIAWDYQNTQRTASGVPLSLSVLRITMSNGTGVPEDIQFAFMAREF